MNPGREDMGDGMRGAGLIKGYYLASPLFLVFSLWWDLEVRATFIPHHGLRLTYYGFITALGILTHYRPGSAPWVAMGESLLNLVLIMLWILLPIYGLADGDPLAGPAGVPYTAGQVLVNGALAGAVFLLGFYRAQEDIMSRFPGLRPKPPGPGRRRDRR
jgi:hypothetical protein